jgi:hypothetical protein
MRMQEVQQHARIAAHRAGNVAQDHQLRGALATPAPRERDPPLPGAHRAAERATQVDASPAGVRPPAAGVLPRELEAHRADRAASDLDLLGAHLLEVARLEQLLPRPGEEDVDARLGFRPLRSRGPDARARGVAHAPISRPPLLRLGPLDAREQVGELGERARRVAPEDLERPPEDLVLVAAAHQHRVERPKEVLPAGEPHRLDGPHGVQRATGADTHAGVPQKPHEADQVREELAADRTAAAHTGAAASSRSTSASRRALSSPRRRSTTTSRASRSGAPGTRARTISSSRVASG